MLKGGQAPVSCHNVAPLVSCKKNIICSSGVGIQGFTELMELACGRISLAIFVDTNLPEIGCSRVELLLVPSLLF